MERNRTIVEISCFEVWRELSNYIDERVDSELSSRMREHFKNCKHCTAVLDGARNVLKLVGDGRAFELPAGFSERLHQQIVSQRKQK